MRVREKTSKNFGKISSVGLKKTGYIFPLNIEYGNKVVDLKNKSKITVKEYFRLNKVLDTIPMNSLVYMKDGKILKGEDFLKELYKYIGLYDTFEELRNSLVTLIEFK